MAIKWFLNFIRNIWEMQRSPKVHPQPLISPCLMHTPKRFVHLCLNIILSDNTLFLLWEKIAGLPFKAKTFQRKKAPSTFLLAIKTIKMQRLGIQYYPHHRFSVLLCASVITLTQNIGNATIPCVFVRTEQNQYVHKLMSFVQIS
jgi:hypothetical protein